MRLIVEGPDGAGKTTLIELLEGMLEVERQPRRVGTDGVALVDLGEIVQQDLRDEVLDPTGLRLYDRHPLISGPIYDPFIHGEFRNHQADPFRMNRLITSLSKFYEQHNFYIFCLPPLPTVIYNLETNPEDQLACFSRDGFIRLHYWAYVNHAMTIQLGVGDPWTFIYDYTQWTRNEDLKDVLANLIRMFIAGGESR